MQLNADARAVFNAMREGITVIDTEGRIIFGNKAYLEFIKKCCMLRDPLDEVGLLMYPLTFIPLSS